MKKNDSTIGATIKKLVAAEQEKKYNEFDARLNELEYGIKHVLGYMKNNEKTMQDIVIKLKKGNLSAEPTKINAATKKDIRNDIISSLSKKNDFSRIEESINKTNTYIKQINADMLALRKEINNIKRTEEATDFDDVVRNIEILRTRSQWIEGRLENFSVKPLIDKIDELEVKINSIRSSSPLVME